MLLLAVEGSCFINHELLGIYLNEKKKNEEEFAVDVLQIKNKLKKQQQTSHPQHTVNKDKV